LGSPNKDNTLESGNAEAPHNNSPSELETALPAKTEPFQTYQAIHHTLVAIHFY